MKPINVVAAIIKKKNYYLIAKRNRNKHMALKWEFPGGKVEVGETFYRALFREIKEELNIEIIIDKKIGTERYKDDKINVILHYYICQIKNGVIKLNEHEDIAWIMKKDFNKYQFAEGDDNILSKI